MISLISLLFVSSVVSSVFDFENLKLKKENLFNKLNVERSVSDSEATCPTYQCVSTVGAPCGALGACVPPLVCMLNSSFALTCQNAPPFPPTAPVPVPECTMDSDCSATEVCSYTSWSCVANTLYLQEGATCTDSDQCFGQLLCEGTPMTCKLPTGTDCSHDAECAWGKNCLDGTCTAWKASGATCTMDDECENFCVAGKCIEPYSIADGASCAGTGTGNEGQFNYVPYVCADGICVMTGANTYQCKKTNALPANDIGTTCDTNADCTMPAGIDLNCSCPSPFYGGMGTICVDPMNPYMMNPYEMAMNLYDCKSTLLCYKDCVYDNMCKEIQSKDKGTCIYENCGIQQYEFFQCFQPELPAGLEACLPISSDPMPTTGETCAGAPGAPAAPGAPTSDATTIPFFNAIVLIVVTLLAFFF